MNQPSASSTDGLSPATVAVTAGRPPRVPDGPLNPPIVLASTYHSGGETGYGRYGNPTWEMFEQAIGALEGGIATSYASGLAATAAVLDLVPDGGTVVAQDQAYYGTLTLLRDLADRGRLTVRTVDLTDLAQAEQAIPGADLVWVESPTNPMLRLTDIAAVMSLTAAAGALGVVDNTFATPVLQRPLADGASVVLHSATKYLSGHSDVLLGVAVAAEPDLAARLVSTRSRQGSIPGTFEAWLALRGLRTIDVRMRQAQESAGSLAERLASCPGVRTVHYPGSGAMLSFEVDGSPGQADLVVGATDLWVNATSLGGVESTLERRRRWSGESAQVPESLIRLSVGIEDVDDLWADLAAAIEAATTGTPGADA